MVINTQYKFKVGQKVYAKMSRLEYDNHGVHYDVLVVQVLHLPYKPRRPHEREERYLLGVISPQEFCGHDGGLLHRGETNWHDKCWYIGEERIYATRAEVERLCV